MPVDGGDALVCAWFQQLGCDGLLDGQDDAIFAPDADGCAPVLDCLDGVLDLEISTVGGEDGVGEIVACSYRSLYVSLIVISSWRGRLLLIRGVGKLTMVMIWVGVYVGSGGYRV